MIEITIANAPVEVGFYNTIGSSRGVLVNGDYAYVADDVAGLRVIDISTPSTPREDGYFDSYGQAMNVAISGNYIYLADFLAGFYVIVPETLTPLALLAMEASALPSGILISWEVYDERDTKGYRLYRSSEDDGMLASVTPGLILADGRRHYQYIDADVTAGATYRYQLASVGPDGHETILGSQSATAAAPAKVTLGQNVPNPFNPQTEIRFVLPARTKVDLSIYDVRGRLVRSLVQGSKDAGEQIVRWDGRNDRGSAVASGVYVYRLRAGKETLSRRMVLLR